jgi:glycosyltransferase involved in cell wall biosynthesis
MLTGQDIIFISSIEWNFVWQGHQEIALRLARAGNRVFYIENTGIRSPGWGDAARIGGRLKRWAKTLLTGGVRQVAPNIWVCSPLVMPPFGSAWQRKLNQRVFLPLIGRAARKLGFRPSLIWTYLPTDTAFDLIAQWRTPENVVVYYCGADFPAVVPDGARVDAMEQELARAADVVFANCATLKRRLEHAHAQVQLATFGVDLAAFPFPPDAGAGTPPELSELPRPLMGYVGGLHRHVDYALLRELALARPDWSFVFVGPEQTSMAPLEGLANVHFLGQKPHPELAGYIRQFDVCLIPYRHNAFTATVVPVKLNEYLAMGKPVVSTDLPVVCEFNKRHDALFISPATSGDFIAAIEAALASASDEEGQLHRRRVAALSDWRIRLDEICAAVERACATQ